MRSTYCGIALLVFACLLAMADGARAVAPVEISVATYNILYRNRDLPMLAETIRRAQADVIALQETTAESGLYLRTNLAKLYPHMVFRGGTVKSDGFGFLSKVPLRNLEFVPVKAPGRGAWMTDLTFQGTDLRLVSVHLSTPQTLAAKTVADMIKTFDQSEVAHGQEIATIYDKIKGKEATIVVGDFNSFPLGRAVQDLLQRGFTDSFASVTKDADQRGTWTPEEPAILRRWVIRLDYVFHTSQFKTTRSRIISSWASDHGLVVSTMELKPPRRTE